MPATRHENLKRVETSEHGAQGITLPASASDSVALCRTAAPLFQSGA